VFVRAPDVILMDVRMPHRSGLELLLALRLAEWETPVILMTGFGDANVHARAEEFGAQAMLDKPVSSARLVREIDRLYSAAKLTSCPPAPKDDIVRAFDTASNDRARGCA